MDIKRVVKAKGYTLVELSKRMGTSKSAVSQIVNGSPNYSTLKEIAEIIGCKVGDFFKDEMTEEIPVEKDSATVLRCPHCGKEIKITINE